MNDILLKINNTNLNELLNSSDFKNQAGEVADKIIAIKNLVDCK